MGIRGNVDKIVGRRAIAVDVASVDILVRHTRFADEVEGQVGLRRESIGTANDDTMRDVELGGIKILRILAAGVGPTERPVRKYV